MKIKPDMKDKFQEGRNANKDPYQRIRMIPKTRRKDEQAKKGCYNYNIQRLGNDC